MGESNGRKASVEIVDSVIGILRVLSVAMKLQTDIHVDRGLGSRVTEFCEKFRANNLVFVGYDFELLPF